TTGGQTYALPPAGWRNQGSGPNGFKGFAFKGTLCTRVKIKQRVIRATCKPDTGDFGPLPEPGPVSIVLAIGKGNARYCGSFGGSPTGNRGKEFKRRDCEAPTCQ